jgi:hypothetical protein
MQGSRSSRRGAVWPSEYSKGRGFDQVKAGTAAPPGEDAARRAMGSATVRPEDLLIMVAIVSGPRGEINAYLVAGTDHLQAAV